MDTSGPLSIVTFAQATFQRSVDLIKRATDGLTDEQVAWQPSSECNSIGWLAWHLSRRKDYYSAKLVDQEQLWPNGWNTRFGLNPEETGLSHTLGEVAAFRHPLDLVLAYVDAADAAASQRLALVQEATMGDEVELDAGRGMRPRVEIWNPMLADCLQHLGQISYLRGLITGKGWFPV